MAFRNKFFIRKKEQDLIRIQRKEEDPGKEIVIKPTPLRIQNERAISRHLFIKRLKYRPEPTNSVLFEQYNIEKETLNETNEVLEAKCNWLRIQALKLMYK